MYTVMSALGKKGVIKMEKIFEEISEKKILNKQDEFVRFADKKLN